MTTTREIYKHKAVIGSRDDFDNLIGIMKKQDPTIIVEDNYDRTLLVSCKQKHDLVRFETTFEKCLKSWLGVDSISCPTKYLYNALPISESNFVLRI